MVGPSARTTYSCSSTVTHRHPHEIGAGTSGSVSSASPLIELCHELADRDPMYERFHVWNMHKNPWGWQHQCAVIDVARRVEVRLLFDLDGLQIGGGWYKADPGQVDRFRSAVADADIGPPLAAIAKTLRSNGFAISGDQMRRPPRALPAEHPQADLGRYRTLIASRHFGSPPWLHTTATINRTYEACQQLQPLTGWLTEHISSLSAR